MFFPITGVEVSPILLASIGFVIGVLGGFFGVGGGFLAGPLMFWSGVPMNFVVGTDLAHMTGKSIVAFRRHRALGHVDVKLGLLMVLGTVPGIELGARIIEILEEGGSVDQVIGVFYIVILVIIGSFTAFESVRALRMLQTTKVDVKDAVGFQAVARRVRSMGCAGGRVHHRPAGGYARSWGRVCAYAFACVLPGNPYSCRSGHGSL
jgi:uncharacterized membrane protein YfcA